jgi:hypothetical protein
MRTKMILAIVLAAVLGMVAAAQAGPMIGPAAQTQFASWYGAHGGHYLDFEELATGTQLDNEYSVTHGVNFKSIRDPNGSTINKPMVVLPFGGSQEISGEPSWGNTSDGRVVYEVTFTSPQRWAGLARHWDNFYTVTKFYNASGLLYTFQNLQSVNGWNKTFLGYLVDSDDPSQWITRIECDGTEPSPGNKQVGYSDDLYFGTAAVAPSTSPLTQTPQATPRGLLLGKATNVKVQVQSTSNALLNVELYRADASLNPTGAPLCTLLDNGAPANGDSKAGDLVYSGIAPMRATSVGKPRFIVRAEVNGFPVLSPPFTLQVVKGLTKTQGLQTTNAQMKAAKIWQQKAGQFGDTLKARQEAVKAIQKVAGVKKVGLSKDQVTLWIEYRSGIYGAIMTQLELGDTGRAAMLNDGGLDEVASLLDAADSDAVPCAAENAAMSASDQAVGNCKVLIYDMVGALGALYGLDPPGKTLAKIYRNAPGAQDYQVTQLNKQSTTGLAPLRRLSEYGTVIIISEGKLDGNGRPFFKTWQPYKLTDLADAEIGLDLITGCLCLWSWPDLPGAEKGLYYAVRPEFFATQPKKLKDSLVLVAAGYSAGDSMVKAFLNQGAKAFFGYSSRATFRFLGDSSEQLLEGLVTNGLNAGNAYARVKPKTDPDDSWHPRLIAKGYKNLAYGCRSLALPRYKYVTSFHSTVFAHTHGNGPPAHETDENISIVAPPTEDRGTIVGQWIGQLFTANWDYIWAPGGIHYSGNMTIQADPLGTRIESFSANLNSVGPIGNGSDQWQKKERIAGGNLALQEYGPYALRAGAAGTATCSHVNGFAWTYLLTPPGNYYDSNVTVQSYNCEPVNEPDSGLFIELGTYDY